MVMSNGCATINPYLNMFIKEECIIKHGRIECHYILTNADLETIIYYIVDNNKKIAIQCSWGNKKMNWKARYYKSIDSKISYRSYNFIPSKYSQIVADMLHLKRTGIPRRLNEI